MFRRRRNPRVPRRVGLRGVVATLAAMGIAAVAVAGRAAGLYPRWVVFAVAIAAGAAAGLWIRRYARK